MNRLRPLFRRLSGVLLAGSLALGLAGCAGNAFDRIILADSSHQAVREALGPGAVKTPEGYALETRNPWPTVVGFMRITAPEGGAAEAKLRFTGRVVHWILFQTLYTDLSYEGRIPQALVDGLHTPQLEKRNEFQASLAEFARSLVETNLPDAWKDAKSLQSDRYRGRLLAVFESAVTDLRGRGKFQSDRFSADITSPAASLHLRYVGEGLYRLEVHGDTNLGPLPVL